MSLAVAVFSSAYGGKRGSPDQAPPTLAGGEEPGKAERVWHGDAGDAEARQCLEEEGGQLGARLLRGPGRGGQRSGPGFGGTKATGLVARWDGSLIMVGGGENGKRCFGRTVPTLSGMLLRSGAERWGGAGGAGGARSVTLPVFAYGDNSEKGEKRVVQEVTGMKSFERGEGP